MMNIDVRRLLTSFSGGKTSGKLAYDMKKKYGHVAELKFVFSNTGLEDERTLMFIDRCDKEFGLNTIWLEAVVDPCHRKGIRHKIVSFETASRNGEPFEAFIAKSGIPNANKPQCSDRLKALVIESYKKSIGWKNCLHAIGIRSDEIKSRRSKSADKFNLCYPMADWPEFITDKVDVNDFWEAQSFNLDIEPHEGNCQTCWKKSDKKLWLLALEHPERFNFMDKMEKTYQDVKPNKNGQQRVFFRRNRSVQDILNEAKEFDVTTLRKMIGADVDSNSGCSESCEAYL